MSAHLRESLFSNRQLDNSGSVRRLQWQLQVPLWQ